VKTKSVFDAYALLAFLKEESGYARVQELMGSEGGDILINSVNVGEVFYVLARERGVGGAEHFLSVVLPGLPITVVQNSFDDVIAAARIKAGHALSYAGCFAAATAIRERTPLVTGDPEFRKLGKELAVDWIG
jgi:predicted nucleic acid-binding protein